LALTDFKQPWIDRRRAPGLTIGYEDASLHAIVRSCKASRPVHAIVRSCKASRPVYAIAGFLQAWEPIAATARSVCGPRVRSW
jgi:hypothetical protein